jgi:hypothetical protein
MFPVPAVSMMFLTALKLFRLVWVWGVWTTRYGDCFLFLFELFVMNLIKHADLLTDEGISKAIKPNPRPSHWLSRVTLVNKKHRFNIFFFKKVKATVF